MRRLFPLDELATGHASTLARRGRGIDHQGFDDRFAAARSQLGLTALSENVASQCGPRPSEESARTLADTVLAGWIESPGHRRNLEGSYATVGTGVASGADCVYVVQLYGSELTAEIR